MMIETKNLHASVPQALLAQAQALANAEQITLDELVCDAMERRLREREMDAVFAFGRAHAKVRGLKPSDVAQSVAEVRSHRKPAR